MCKTDVTISILAKYTSNPGVRLLEFLEKTGIMMALKEIGRKNLVVSSDVRLFSKRELEVLILLANGMTSDEVAKELYIEPTTVNTHRRKMIKQLSARNTTHMVYLSCRMGWI